MVSPIGKHFSMMEFFLYPFITNLVILVYIVYRNIYCVWSDPINGRLHTNLSTNFTQDHVLSPFLMVSLLTSITISILNIPLILNMQLHSWDSCKCNCQNNWKIDILYIMPYKSLWIVFNFFTKPQIQFYINKDLLLSPSTGNLRRKLRMYW